MSQFSTNEITLKPLMDGRTWELADGFCFIMPSPLDGLEFLPREKTEPITLCVPRGFKTDLASVPRLFWNILPPFGVYDRAAILHDYLYRHHGVAGFMDRASVDRIFLEAMAECGTALWKRWLIYLNVRAFGWIAWNHEPS